MIAENADLISAIRQASINNMDVKEIARRFDISLGQVYKHSRRIGISRAPHWSEAEKEILEKNSYKPPHLIRKILQQQGFHRTESSIKHKRRQLIGLLRDTVEHNGLFLISDISVLLGVSVSMVHVWINQGLLAAKKQPCAVGAERFGGTYLVKASDLRRFIVSHPIRLRAECVDLVWLVDFLVNS